MIRVRLIVNGVRQPYHLGEYLTGVHAVPDENGWISIVDEDGLTLGMHPKEHVIAIHIGKAGESTMKVENPG